MVYVNSQKFACESCIKGHRSSSCHHTDRPLFEIKKKGRPVSQCTKCRELRQSKKFHSKCTCNHEKEKAPAMQPLSSSSGSKTRRFIPIVPALPNGLRDVLTASQSSSSRPPDIRQRVDTLLNPCDCKSVWKCQCKNKSSTSSSVPENHQIVNPSSGLSALAQAAAMRCCSPSREETISAPSSLLSSHSRLSTKSKTANIRPRPPSPVYSNKRQKQDDQKYHAKTVGPDLAPILYSPETTLPTPRSTPMPDFPFMPPMSTITSLAGSGCTCGLQCSCPGCVEHRGPTHADSKRRNCADGCGTCIDPTLGMSLPSSSLGEASSFASGSGTSILDRFFAQAAALPPPPSHRKLSLLGLDPMDTTRYSDYSRPQGAQSFAFGTVKIPKLECCSGQCNCPAGRCTCRATCAGCCSDEKVNQKSPSPVPVAHSRVKPIEVTPPVPIRSCCARKV